ncbi:MAG TPA: CoA transferase [Paracoccaceae bacterium]|nr:CoA transferase [Paracoccaceae bacterium]
MRHNVAVRAQVIVLAGPSGSGKSRLCRRLGLPFVNLDDFYKDGDDPTLPSLDLGGGSPIVDWDSPVSWHRAHALDTIERLDLLTMEGIDGEFANLLTPPGNGIARDTLDAHFRTRPRAEWLELLDGAGVPCGPVGKRDDWFASETVRANGMRVELDHPELGRVAIPGVPVIFADTPGEVRELVRDVAPEDLPPHTPTADGAPREGITNGHGPLSGVTVLDFGQVIAGTYPSSILASWGANVIKVESPGGDIFRTYGLGFLGYNHGKRGIVIDLKQEAGRETLHDLVRHADVVIDNFRMGVTERLGMDHATLSAINPRVITISVTGYGPKGPLARKPGFDPLLQAISGIMHHQGGGQEPIFHQLPVNDVAAGMTTAFATAAALYAREQTGRGQHIDTSLANVSVVCQTPDITEVPGRQPPIEGSLDCAGVSALRRFYRCADGWIAIAVSDPAQFHGLCNALEHPIWAARHIAEQALAAPVDGDLAGEIASVLAEMPREEALDRLLAHGVPAAPDAGDPALYEDSWLRASGLWAEYEDPVFGTITAVSGFAAYGRTPGGFRYGVPRLGEHTREVLREAGFDDARLEALEAAGGIAQFREL